MKTARRTVFPLARDVVCVAVPVILFEFVIAGAAKAPILRFIGVFWGVVLTAMLCHLLVAIARARRVRTT